jgi:hypothetical protein
MAEGEPKLQINRVIEQFYLVEFAAIFKSQRLQEIYMHLEP